MSSKSYTRPGKTLPLTKDNKSFSQHSHNTHVLRASDVNYASARCTPLHQGVDENSEYSDTTRYAGNRFPSHSSGGAEIGKVVNRQNGADTSLANNSHSRGIGGISSNHAIGVSKTRESDSTYADGTEEDDILQVFLCVA